MKKLYNVIAVAAAFASLVACQKYADYYQVPFASLDKASMKVTEDASGVVVSLPVHVYHAAEGCSVAYEVVDGTAKQGLDYTVVDGTGVLNFAAGEETKEIKFNIVGQPGTYTGNTKFTVTLKSATNEVTLGSIDVCTITIADTDHPLTALFGTYEYHAYQLNDETEQLSYYGWKSMTISPYDGDPTRVWIDKLFVLQLWYPSYLPNGGGKCYAVVSDDMKTISIPVPQDFNTNGVNLFSYDAEWYIFKCNGDTFSDAESNIVFTLQEDGSYVTTDDFGLNTMEDFADGMFYYGMNSYSNEGKPTYFKKID